MFSANENILLRQHKKRVVEYVESTIPENILDLGVNVMAMQVTCTTPGCVPIETAIIIIFPKLNHNDVTNELLPGLPESATGGSYKTKILKPLSEVTQNDVLDALPPSFMGGTRSITKLCLQIRDALFGHITQLFDEDIINDKSAAEGAAAAVVTTTTTTTTETPANMNSNEATDAAEDVPSLPVLPTRQLVAQYLQECLKEYINNNCIPPEIGQPYPDVSVANNHSINSNDETETTTAVTSTNTKSITTPTIVSNGEQQQQKQNQFKIPSTGNITLPRPIDDDYIKNYKRDDATDTNKTQHYDGTQITSVTISAAATTTTTPPPSRSTHPEISLVNSSVRRRQQDSAVRVLIQTQGNHNNTANSILTQLASQQQYAHGRGIRRSGCPCCDPDNTATIVDQFLSQT